MGREVTTMELNGLDAYLASAGTRDLVPAELPDDLRLGADGLRALAENTRDDIMRNVAMRNGSVRAAAMTSTR